MVFVAEGFFYLAMGVDVINTGKDQLGLLVVQGQADLLIGLFLAGVQRKFLSKFVLRDGFKTEGTQILRNIRQFQRQQVNVPLGQLADLVIHQPEGLDLFLRQLVGYDAGDGRKAQLFRRLEAGVAGDDFMVGGNHQRDEKAVLPDAFRHRIHGPVILSRIVLVWVNLPQGELYDIHKRPPE